jgi:hypothetical protein
MVRSKTFSSYSQTGFGDLLSIYHKRSVNKRRYLGFFGNVRALEDRVAAVLLDLFVRGSV